MISITPQGSVYLCETPLENDYKHQLTFANVTAQRNYFTGSSVLKHTCTDFTYIKKDNQLIVDFPVDSIINCNYLYYQNTGFTNKYYYAFITNMEYVNENATRITFEIDAFQTYMFDIVYKKSFVEREHVNDDTLGKNLVPENLETGEYVAENQTIDTSYNDRCIVIATPVDIDALLTTPPTSVEDLQYRTGVYNNIPAGCCYYRFDYLQNIPTIIKRLADFGVSDQIISMFLAPKSICTNVTGAFRIADTNTVASKDVGISRVSTLDGYTPKNNKCLTFPYCFINVTNGVGQSAVYKQEYWTLDENNEMVISELAVLNPGLSIKAIPRNYKGIDKNYDEGISIGKFPQLTWLNDAYTNWLTQNGVNLGFKTLNANEWATSKGLIQTGAGLMQLGTNADFSGIENVTGGLSSVFNQMQENYKHSFTAYQLEGSLNTGDVATAGNYNALAFSRMTITYEFAKRIDDYFSTFGYRVNEFKTPNVTGRAYWNYVKTNDCNLEGNIPRQYVKKLEMMFNNGITFWHDPTKFLDYTQNNAIVS